MATKKKKTVKESPVQTTTMDERTVYKAFIQKAGNDDMIVDTNGDIFSVTVTDALVNFFETMSMETLFAIPALECFFTNFNEPPQKVDSEVPTNPNYDRVVVMKLSANDENEFKEAKGEVSERNDFIFVTSKLKEGYRLALAEYAIVEITVHQRKGGNTVEVKKLTATTSDTTEFPLTVSIF